MSRPSDQRYWTMTDLESYQREQDERRRARRIREHGPCPVCGEPRFQEARFGRYVGLVCTKDAGHTPHP